MKTKWIIVGALISLLVHVSLVIFIGKIEFNFSKFDFIETYLLERKSNIVPKQKQVVKIENTSFQQIPETPNQYEDLDEKQANFYSETSSFSSLQIDQNIDFQNLHHHPFTRFINEKMKFDIYWMGIYVGEAFIYVTADQNNLTITFTVKSSNFISNFYYVNDRAESIIQNGKPKRFTLLQIEGKYRGNKETIFDYEKGEIIFINHLKNKITYHKEVNRLFMDVLSGFFYLRAMQIKLNEPLSVDIFDSNKFITVKVYLLGEEKIELSNKKQFETFIIKPQIETEGLFKRKGDIIIWLTKDEKKIPVKIETRISIGQIVAELKEYTQ